ncbi:MAG: hypothetical protein ABS35_25340 [Kaistia sp. SCN 65-12]|nr:MAG: hypothetical protein ABS35_25340 [Kaistia sp. SCN 65-12]
MSYAFDWHRSRAVAPTAEPNALPSPMAPGLSDGSEDRLAGGLPLGKPDRDDDTTSDIVWTLAYWPWL